MARGAIQAARQTPDRSLRENETTLRRLCHCRYVRERTAPVHPADHHATNNESRSRDSRTQYWLGGVGCEWKSRFADWRAGAIVTRRRHSVVRLGWWFVPRQVSPRLDMLAAETIRCRLYHRFDKCSVGKMLDRPRPNGLRLSCRRGALHTKAPKCQRSRAPKAVSSKRLLGRGLMQAGSWIVLRCFMSGSRQQRQYGRDN